MAKRGICDNPKTRRLARALGTVPGVAVGILETLWQWVEEFRKDGFLSSVDFEDAMDAPGWLQMFSVEKIVAAMTDESRQCVWLDPVEGGFVVHDWHEHCNDSVHLALARAKKFFANGTEPTYTRLPEKEKTKAAEFYSSPEAGVVRTACTRRAHGILTEYALPSPPLPSLSPLIALEETSGNCNQVPGEPETPADEPKPKAKKTRIEPTDPPLSETADKAPPGDFSDSASPPCPEQPPSAVVKAHMERLEKKLVPNGEATDDERRKILDEQIAALKRGDL